jgi:hypothetical protein
VGAEEGFRVAQAVVLVGLFESCAFDGAVDGPSHGSSPGEDDEAEEA